MAIDPDSGSDAPASEPVSGTTTAPTVGEPAGRSRRGRTPRGAARRGPDVEETNEQPALRAADEVAPEVVTPAPVAAPEPGPSEGRRGRRRRIKARQVQRVVTRIDPWSMLKVSLIFALSIWLIVVVAGVILWRVAVSTGTIGNVENFLAEILAEESFTIDGEQIFQGSIIVGLVFFVTGAVFAVVTSVLFNLISAVVGGIRCTVVELETARPADAPAPSGAEPRSGP
jgi:hypothetical protein